MNISNRSRPNIAPSGMSTVAYLMVALMLLPIALFSCNNQQDDDSFGSRDTIETSITFGLDDRSLSVLGSLPTTKDLVLPDVQGKKTIEVGLLICDGGTFTYHAVGYNNMLGKCVMEKSHASQPVKYTWSFIPSNTTVEYDEIGIRLVAGKTVDIYSYAPHKPGMGYGPKGIPYKISNDDFMYSRPIVGATSGRQMLNFEHAMTCFSFQVYSTRVGSVTLGKVKLYDRASRNLVFEGVFDTTTGLVAEDGRVFPGANEAYVVEINKSLGGTPSPETSFDVVVPPIYDYRDGEIEVTMVFGSTETKPIKIPLAAAELNPVTSKYEFKSGVRYMFKINVDNYNKFKKLDLESWSAVPQETVKIDV